MTVWRYRASVERVVDGDTLDVKIDLGFKTYKDVRVRLAEVDTAEIYGVPKESDEYKQGMIHKEFVEDWLPQNDDWPIVVETEGDDDTGKYGRYLARIYRAEDEELNDAIKSEFPNVSELQR